MSSATGTDAEIAAHLRSRLNAGLERIAFFIIPSAVALLALGDLIVRLLLQSGVWHQRDTIWVWQILAGSAIGLLASTMGRLYSSTFYALRDTRTPLRFAIIRVVLTTALGYVAALVLPGALGLDPKLGAAGLTASAGFAGWIEFLLLRHALRKRIGPTGLSKATAASLWIAALIAAALPWAYKLFAQGSGALAELATRSQSKRIAFALLVVYGLLYLVLTSAQGIPEARVLTGRLSRLVRRGARSAIS
jgi:putative peptidoglycan lipid II flippase